MNMSFAEVVVFEVMLAFCGICLANDRPLPAGAALAIANLLLVTHLIRDLRR